MTKTYTFNKTNNKKNTTFTSIFHKPDYSSTLDNIILTNVIKKNDYLFKTNKDADVFIDNIGISSPIDTDFIKAAKFLANYKSNKEKHFIPFTLGKAYKLSNGDYIIFYEDEIQIGYETYKYSDFSNLSFLDGLNADTKKIIINIYTTGSANININLL